MTQMERYTGKENQIITSNEKIILFHGSKSGIEGTIAPKSRDKCDFGKGFYMGTEQTQPLTLICNYPDAKIYTLSVDLSGLKIMDIEVGLDWALLVAYNRGKMESAKGTSIYNRYADLDKSCDMVVGYIANDRMFVVLDRFFNGEITDLALINSLSALKLGKQYVAKTENTDLALINSLSALKLGKQYVAKTEKACKNIKIIEEQEINEEQREKLKYESEINRSRGIELAESICRKYRREGRFFDEILEAGGQYA